MTEPKPPWARAFGDMPDGINFCSLMVLLIGVVFIGLGLVLGFGIAGMLMGLGALMLFFGSLWL